MTNFHNLIKSIIIITLTCSVMSCSYRPIFAPNAKFKTSGEKIANQDADQCQEEAEKYLKASKKRRAVKETARGAGMGALFGVIFGLFTGNVRGVVKSAAIGAGIGGAIKGGGVLAEDRLKPDQIKQRYISRCLSKKGYHIIGWE